MIEIGRLCLKIAGRDAGLKCIIVEVIDDNFVTIDGQTRRRKCNIKHIEPLDQVIKLKAKASHADVVSEFKKLKIDIKERKSKKAGKRPRKVRKKKEKPVEEKPTKEKAETKEKPKKEAKKKEEKK